MTAETSPFVVSFEWLSGRLGDPHLRIVDASWYLPQHNRDPRAEFGAARIPGAVFFDQDRIVAPGSDLPHTLASPDDFAAAVGTLGLGNDDVIVVYDGPGMFSAPRVWWMLGLNGARNVFVLDGGFDRWRADGLPVATGPAPMPAPVIFRPAGDRSPVATFEEMQAIVVTGACQIADARSPGRFAGTEAEPRAGMRSGHMPGARNVPISTLTTAGRLKDLAGLRDAFDEAGLDLARPVVTSCGSGVTASVIMLALASLGHADNRLYDGSWAEWGGRNDTPVVMGNA